MLSIYRKSTCLDDGSDAATIFGGRARDGVDEASDQERGGRSQWLIFLYCIIISAIEVEKVIFLHLCVSMSVRRHKISNGYELISMKFCDLIGRN